MSRASGAGVAIDAAGTQGGSCVTGNRLSFLTMISICIGLVIVQGSMVSATQGIGLGGSGFIAAMLCAFVLAIFNAMTFAELSLMYPQSGGSLATYTQKAMGHFPAIVAVFAGYVVVAMFSIPVEMLLVNSIVNELLPGMFPDMLIPTLILVLLAITNILGTDVFARIQNLLAFVLILCLVVVGLVASTSEAPVLAEGSAVNWSLGPVMDGSFVGLISLAMWMMVGVEFICPLIADVNEPRRTIPRAMMLSLVLMLAIYLPFVFGASRFMSVESLTTSAIPYLDYVHAVFGKAGLVVATVMGIAATCSTVNTVLASVPRMLQGMADNRQAFPQMGIVSQRFGTPWVAIVFMVIIIAIPMYLMGIDSLITLVIAASTSWLLAYIIAHINVLVLRRRQPELARPYKTPFYPLPQLLGIVGMVYVALHNSPSPEMTEQVYTMAGGVLLLVCVIGAVWVKGFMKKGLFTPE